MVAYYQCVLCATSTVGAVSVHLLAERGEQSSNMYASCYHTTSHCYSNKVPLNRVLITI